jgi:hypothetical protein
MDPKFLTILQLNGRLLVKITGMIESLLQGLHLEDANMTHGRQKGAMNSIKKRPMPQFFTLCRNFGPLWIPDIPL